MHLSSTQLHRRLTVEKGVGSVISDHHYLCSKMTSPLLQRHNHSQQLLLSHRVLPLGTAKLVAVKCHRLLFLQQHSTTAKVATISKGRSGSGKARTGA